MIITASENIAQEIVDTVSSIPHCVLDLCIIQRQYRRGMIFYREVENLVEDHFRDLILGFAVFFMHAAVMDVEVDAECSYRAVIDNAITLITQHCLNNDWRESGPTAVN